MPSTHNFALQIGFEMWTLDERRQSKHSSRRAERHSSDSLLSNLQAVLVNRCSSLFARTNNDKDTNLTVILELVDAMKLGNQSLTMFVGKLLTSEVLRSFDKNELNCFNIVGKRIKR